jgi:hypothetical protein
MAASKYNDTFPERAEGLAREGLVDVEIAKCLGVSTSTLDKYKQRYPEFREALLRGKAPIDTGVESALLKRAMGYEVTETSVTHMPDGAQKIEVKKKHIAPDTTACIYWLKNRKPEQWRDKRDIEHSGSISLHFDKEDYDL